ncbi:unnamed protein product [Boreogadus saida]
MGPKANYKPHPFCEHPQQIKRYLRLVCSQNANPAPFHVDVHPYPRPFVSGEGCISRRITEQGGGRMQQWGFSGVMQERKSVKMNFYCVFRAGGDGFIQNAEDRQICLTMEFFHGALKKQPSQDSVGVVVTLRTAWWLTE